MVRRSPDAPDCGLVRDAIDAHLSGLLPAAQRAAIEAHIARCPVCRDELELAADIRRELSALPRLDAPPRVIEAVRRRVQATTIERPAVATGRSTDRRRRPWVALAAAAAAVFALAGVVILAGRFPRTSQQASAVEIARATAEARLAFSLLADATATVQRELRQGVLRERVVAPVLRGISGSVIARGRSSSAQRSHPTPNIVHGGSS